MSPRWESEPRSTGTQCYEVWHLLLASMVAFAAAYLIFVPLERPMIGNDKIPMSLSCENDEVIGPVQVGDRPYDMGCVHIEGVAK